MIVKTRMVKNMNRCNKCNVLIENNLKKCPLCLSETEVISDEYDCSYPEIKKSQLNDIIKKLFLFLAVGGSVVCFFVNIYIGGIPWSMICVAGYFYLYFSAKVFFVKARNIPLNIMLQIILLSITVPVVDYAIGWVGWSIDYVLPLVQIAGSVVLFVFGLLKPIKFSEYIFYIFMVAFFGIIPFVLLMLNLVSVIWPSIACVLYSFLSLLYMLVFARRKFNNELQKRLHT